MLWSITVIFAILAGLIVFFVVLALLIAALGAGTGRYSCITFYSVC